MWPHRKDPVAEHSVAPAVDRYGTSRNRRLDKWIGGTLTGALILGGIAFLAFGGLPTAESSIEFRDIAHRIDDSDTLVSLTFEVTAPAEREVVCEIEALNPSYAVVGMRLIELPAIDQRTRTVTEEIRTHNRATTATVKECWVQPEA